MSSSQRTAGGSEASTAGSSDAVPRLGRSPGGGCNYTTAVAWDDESFGRVCQQAFQVWRKERTDSNAGALQEEQTAADLSQDFEGFCSDVTTRSPATASRFSKYLTSLPAEDHLLVKSCPVQIATLSNGIRRISDQTVRTMSPQPAPGPANATKIR